MKKSTLAVAGMLAAVSSMAVAPAAFAKEGGKAIYKCAGCTGCKGCKGCKGCGGCGGCHGCGGCKGY